RVIDCSVHKSKAARWMNGCWLRARRADYDQESFVPLNYRVDGLSGPRRSPLSRKAHAKCKHDEKSCHLTIPPFLSGSSVCDSGKAVGQDPFVFRVFELDFFRRKPVSIDGCFLPSSRHALLTSQKARPHGQARNSLGNKFVAFEVYK